jgi:hypothetical protein
MMKKQSEIELKQKLTSAIFEFCCSAED